jgi:uncharacterized protein YidB (DUF937 family)
MGLFDTLARQAMGGMLGGSDPATAISGLFQEAGGLEGLRSRFQSAGLEEAFASWVGTGVNQAIAPEQLQAVLGQDNIRQLASRVGFDPQMLLPLMSQFLPQIIDKLTPGGSVEQNIPGNDLIQSALASVLKSGLGGFFGGRS